MATPTIDPLYDPAPKDESQLWDYVHVLLCRRRLLIEKQNPNVLNVQGVTKERGGSDISDDYQTLPEVRRSGFVQGLRIELANLERQQAQLLERDLDQPPEVVKVRNQLQSTRGKIRGQARRVIRAAENDYKAAAQEASVSSALESAKQETLQLSARAVSYDSQKREVEAALQVLDGLMFRSKQTDVASEPESTNIRVVRTPLNYSWSEPGSRIITVTSCSHCFGRYYGPLVWPVPRQARRQVPRSLPAPG